MNEYNFHIATTITSVESASAPDNDNEDWALDLHSAFRVLREVRRMVLIRRKRHPLKGDTKWLRENLTSLQEIWGLLAARKK